MKLYDLYTSFPREVFTVSEFLIACSLVLNFSKFIVPLPMSNENVSHRVTSTM